MNCFAKGCENEAVDSIVVATPEVLTKYMADPPATVSLPLCADHLAEAKQAEP